MRSAAALALILATACTSSPTATPSISSSPSAIITSPAPVVSSPAAPKPVVFSVARAMATLREIVRRAPRREAATAAYRRAAAIVAERFAASGYTVRRQRFAVPGGTCDGIAVSAGTSQNVIAEPPGFNSRKPYLLVGGHLDSVPDSPGANDDASGPAVIVELARLATLRRPHVAVVFVALGAEERRKGDGFNMYSLGARAYLRALDARQRKALQGFVNIDMVGAGSHVQIIGGRGPMVSTLYAAARRLGVRAEVHASIANGFSDHVTFQRAGYSVGWLWAGDNPTLHTPRDTLAIIQPAELRRIGRVAWEALSRFR